ncbi:MAG: MFS transporter [Acidimicrobiia bacterium]|nr:MFS transporter [Acidimicrobiia bacterium]
MRKTAVAVAALFFTNGAAFASWAPRIPELADRIGVDLAGLGLTLLMMGVGGLVGTGPAGRLIDRFGSRRVAIAGAVAVSVAVAGMGLARSPMALGMILLIVGAADVSADLGMNAQAVAVQIRGSSAINRLHGLWSIGTVAGGSIGAAAAGAGISIESHLLVVGTLMAGVAWASNRGLADTATSPPPESEAPSSTRPMVLLGLLGLAAAFLEAPGAEWSATFIDDAFGSGPATAALGFVAFTAGMTVSRLVGDSIATRWGATRSFTGSLPVAAAGWTAVVIAPGPVVAIAGFAVAGLGTGMIFPQLYASGASGVLVSQGRGLSAMSFGARLGFLLVTPSVGLLGSRIGLDAALAWIMAPVLVALFVLGRRGATTARLHKRS